MTLVDVRGFEPPTSKSSWCKSSLWNWKRERERKKIRFFFIHWLKYSIYFLFIKKTLYPNFKWNCISSHWIINDCVLIRLSGSYQGEDAVSMGPSNWYISPMRTGEYYFIYIKWSRDLYWKYENLSVYLITDERTERGVAWYGESMVQGSFPWHFFFLSCSLLLLHLHHVLLPILFI